MSHSLTGHTHFNFNNLKGTHMNQTQPIPIKIKKIKERIVTDYLIPIFTNQWSTINENICFIENIQKNINYYYKTYKLDELGIYVELLKIIRILMDNKETIVNYENKITNKSINKSNNQTNQTNNTISNDVVSILFNTTKIRLRPEYEIYDSIIGKPNKELNETYSNDIIWIIKKQLEQENMTYQKIKETVEKIMPSHFEN